MVDIALTEDGDLQLGLYDTNSTDFVLAEKGDELSALLKRALQTPLGYIGQFQIDLEAVRKYNFQYGNNIYKELSENLSGQLLTRVRSHIVNAVRVAELEAQIQDVRIQIQDMRTLNIYVVFSDNQTIQVPFRI